MVFGKIKAGLASLKAGLARTHNAIMGSVESAFSAESREDILERLEEALITSDVGVHTSGVLVDRLRSVVIGRDPERMKEELKSGIYEILKKAERPLDAQRRPDGPFVIMVLGVNGVGKTTTIGKLAARYAAEGKNVFLAAGDTFRAAAVEQLELWGKRTGATVIKQAQGGDPGAVVFDAIRSAQSRGADIVILDTAGRLHTKVNLMEELKKVQRVVKKEMPLAPHECLLVLDASTGQNAMSQAKLFNEAVGVTGIALTKLDGTAKGGIIIAIANEFDIPIRLVGIGEKPEDLKDFDAKDFVDALI